MAKRTKPGTFARARGLLAMRPRLVPFSVLAALMTVGLLSADRGRTASSWFGGVIVLAGAWFATSPSMPGATVGADGRRRLGRFGYALFAFTLATGAFMSEARTREFDVAGVIGAWVLLLLAVVSTAKLEDPPGLAGSLPRRRHGAEISAGFVMTGAVLAAVYVRASEPVGAMLVQDESVAACVALTTVALLGWAATQIHALRLGARERAATSLAVSLLAMTLAVAVLSSDDDQRDRRLWWSCSAAALVIVAACTAKDAERIARMARRVVVLTVLGGPLILLGALAAEGPAHRLAAVVVTGVVALLVGSALLVLEGPFKPAEGRLLDAIEAARTALLRADPESSLQGALAALRTLSGPGGSSPELFWLDPARVVTIDAAGYPRERRADVPKNVVEIATAEAEGTLRADLLVALEVRRPDLRPLSRWMDERDALAATLIVRDGASTGLIVVPRGSRRAPLALEEVRALRRLGEAFAGAEAAASALERSREREAAARARADASEEALLARDQAFEAAALGRLRVAELLAQGAGAGPYSPAARLAMESFTRAMEQKAPLLVVSHAGSDVLPYLAKAHVEGGRAGVPFVAVDACAPAARVAQYWRDPRASPLALADGGVLVVLDAARLPVEIQRTLAAALRERRRPWEHAATLELQLVVTGSSPAAGSELDPELATRIGAALDAPVVWPALAERGEDLHALLLAGLAREGLRIRGEPLGLDAAAYARLANYPFPGDERLRVLTRRLASSARGPVVGAADVEALGLASDAEEADGPDYSDEPRPIAR